jgi:ATP phosphoribosyltransferase regulatory subunit
MLRPERQFLQVGSEIIGSDSILADIEIISLAYKSLKDIGIKNITLELTSKIFLAEVFSKIKDLNSLNKLKTYIKQKDIKNSLALIKHKDDRLLLKCLFNLTGSYRDLDKKIKNIKLLDSLKSEIDIIKEISKKLNFKNNDQIIIDFTEIDNKNYHDGIKFTFFAKHVRGEIASGGRYKIKRNVSEESAVGFTCFMDTVLRASSFENSKKKILIPFETDDDTRIKLRKQKYIIYSYLGDISGIRLSAKNNLCTHIYENNKIKKI